MYCTSGNSTHNIAEISYVITIFTSGLSMSIVGNLCEKFVTHS